MAGVNITDVAYAFKQLAPPSESARAQAIWDLDGSTYPGGIAEYHRATKNVHAVGCYFVKDIVIGERGVLQKNGEFVLDPPVVVEYVKGFINEGRFDDVNSRNVVNCRERAVIAFDHGYACYGHFIVDMLPRLMIGRVTIGGDEFSSLSIVVPDGAPEWLYRMIEHVFPKNSIIRFDQKACRLNINDAVIPTFCHDNYYFHGVSSELFYAIRRAILHDDVHAKSGRPLFLSRSTATQSRVMVNREEIEGIAEEIGFEVVDPASHAWEKQVLKYFHAPLIAGEYGSALHNSIFSRYGVGVLAINPTQYLQSRLGALNGARTAYIYADKAWNDPAWRHLFHIDPDQFRRMASAALACAAPA